MRYFVSSLIGFVVGAMIGAVLGPVADILLQALFYRPRFSQLNLFRLRTTLFALGGAVVVGLLGLIIALAIVFFRRPKLSTLDQS
jgi:hypothetical protein